MGGGGGIVGMMAAQHRLQGNSLAGAAMEGPGLGVEQRVRNVEAAYKKEVRKLTSQLRNETDPAKIDQILDQLDKLKQDMHNALDHIKDTSGCQDTSAVDMARQRMEETANDAEKWMLDKQWDGRAPDFLRWPEVRVKEEAGV